MCCWTIQNYVTEATGALKKKNPDDDPRIETSVGV
jgi:hypothetical protein